MRQHRDERLEQIDAFGPNLKGNVEGRAGSRHLFFRPLLPHRRRALKGARGLVGALKTRRCFSVNACLLQSSARWQRL